MESQRTFNIICQGRRMQLTLPQVIVDLCLARYRSDYALRQRLKLLALHVPTHEQPRSWILNQILLDIADLDLMRQAGYQSWPLSARRKTGFRCA